MTRFRQEDFGDYQTPAHLARQVCQLLSGLDVKPQTVVEPSCGYGAFLRAARESFPNARIWGYEINPDYVAHARSHLTSGVQELIIEQADFFSQNWMEVLGKCDGQLLILGNPPWVTNAEQGASNSFNLPEKTNDSGFTGLSALTGRSNFDISEWMCHRYLEWLNGREGWIAVLIKEKVARKIIARIWNKKLHFDDIKIYLIDAKKDFQVNVSACLFYARSSPSIPSPSKSCKVYATLSDDVPRSEYSTEKGRMISNSCDYFRYRHLIAEEKPNISWRSGVKHDCAEVFEVRAYGKQWINGFNEVFSAEDKAILPLLKSSDLYNHKIDCNRHMLLPTPDLVTSAVDHLADCPLALSYLAKHADRLARRKSRIYLNKPAYSVFGIGPYSLLPWKVAVSGLYKIPRFVLIGPVNGKPVLFDDTVYFISFDNEAAAVQAYQIVSSEPFQRLLSSMMFTADKRPVTAELLNRIDLTRVGQEIGIKLNMEFLSTQVEPTLFG